MGVTDNMNYLKQINEYLLTKGFTSISKDETSHLYLSKPSINGTLYIHVWYIVFNDKLKPYVFKVTTKDFDYTYQDIIETDEELLPKLEQMKRNFLTAIDSERNKQKEYIKRLEYIVDNACTTEYLVRDLL